VMSVRVPRGESVSPRTLVAVVVILTGYGALLEVLQDVVSARSFQIGDVLANALGTLIGAAIAAVARRSRR